jgi:hypothetical protein
VALPVEDRAERGLASSVEVRAAPFLELLLGLVADTGATGRANGAADDRARRPGHRATDDGTGRSATKGTRAGPGFVIGTLGGLARDCTTDGADRAADDRTGRTTDCSTDGRATERPSAGSHGFTADLVIVGHVANRVLAIEIRVERIDVPACRVVRSIHLARLLKAEWGALTVRAQPTV